VSGREREKEENMRVLLVLALLSTGNGLSVDEFEKLRRECGMRSAPWATIPWEASLTRARSRALRERKPVFMMVDTGSPIGRG
jgi:hypothetical protein